MFNLIIQSLIEPFTQNLLYDCAKKLYSVCFKSEERLFFNAIKNSVYNIHDNLNCDLKNAIIHSIYNGCKGITKIDIYKIVSREFKQWGEENADAHNVTVQICINLIEEIDGIPDLREKIVYQNVFAIKDSIDNYQNKSEMEYIATKQQLDLISSNQNQANKYMIDILEILRKNAEKVSDSVYNSQYIPDEYKDYFLNDLFLEKKISDGKNVCLKDVYIPNTFRILDFPFENSTIEYDNLIQFICDFIDSKLNAKKYHTRYSYSSDFINVLFIKGLPGCGKSSLFYYLAYRKAHDSFFFPEYRFYFIKLIEVYNALNRKLSIDSPLEDIEAFLY